jgi:hypothetical protein
MPAERSRTQLCSCSSPSQLPSLPPHLDTLRHRAPPPSSRGDVMNFFKTKTRTPTDLARGLRDNILKLESAPPGEPRKKVRVPVRSVLCRSNAYMGASPLPSISTRPAKRLASTCSRLRACSTVMGVRFSTFRPDVLLHDALPRACTGALCAACAGDIQHRSPTLTCRPHRALRF